ncbi:JmjC domain-containing protein [Pectobacterium brasiliense]|uniref:JmjC domain-containing protein n=1 Tax=Pectobacterium brasiliense TaxID=180957 RepID=UPI0036713A0B
MSNFFSYLDAHHFFEKHWNKSYYKFTTDFQKPNTKKILNDVLTSNIQYPDFRIIQRGGSINPYLYTKSDNNSLSNQISNDKFKVLDLTGKTIKISSLNQYAKEVKFLANDVSNYFSGINISINGYFSEGKSQGGSSHYDFHHIFAFQISGKKKWNIGNIVENNPHRDFGHRLIENTDYVGTVTTSPGDVLYLPPGIWHDVSTEDSSVHFAIGIQTPRIFNLLHQAIKHISKNSSLFRKDLPLRYIDNLEKVGLTNNEIEEILHILKKHLMENNGAKFL